MSEPRHDNQKDPNSTVSSNSAYGEVLGMVVDGIVLYGMYVTAKFVYKVNACLDNAYTTKRFICTLHSKYGR